MFVPLPMILFYFIYIGSVGNDAHHIYNIYLSILTMIHVFKEKSLF